ncbi:hypothetical protein [Pseudomonas sp. NPDC089569]|uniref:hypothetical protein n=1 Tax=Pseudomonas sp. NPDC089569 TaxID=3390722 RepID=UPI003D08746F
MLAMVVNDYAGCLTERVAPTCFASMLAPTESQNAKTPENEHLPDNKNNRTP